MIESGAAEPLDDHAGPEDTLHYLYEISGELAGMASAYGYTQLAAAYELARGLAGEARAGLQRHSLGKAAPDDAA